MAAWSKGRRREDVTQARRSSNNKSRDPRSARDSGEDPKLRKQVRCPPREFPRLFGSPRKKKKKEFETLPPCDLFRLSSLCFWAVHSFLYLQRSLSTPPFVVYRSSFAVRRVSFVTPDLLEKLGLETHCGLLSSAFSAFVAHATHFVRLSPVIYFLVELHPNNQIRGKRPCAT